MSGYLQRLVQTAAKPAQSVHPFAGSVFAQSLSSQSDESALESSVIAESPHQGPPQPKPRGREIPASDDRAPVPAPVRAAAPPFFAEDADSAPPPWPEEVVARSSPRLRASTNVAAIDFEERRTQDTPPREFEALLPHATVAEEELGSHAPLASVIRPLQHNQRSAAPGSAREDIQIHIGRIEVTAVPPPAPRAPKSPDRSPSLGAYLNRSAR